VGLANSTHPGNASQWTRFCPPNRHKALIGTPTHVHFATIEREPRVLVATSRSVVAALDAKKGSIGRLLSTSAFNNKGLIVTLFSVETHVAPRRDAFGLCWAQALG